MDKSIPEDKINRALLMQIVDDAVKAEREACAKIANDVAEEVCDRRNGKRSENFGSSVASEIEKRIRARGE